MKASKKLMKSLLVVALGVASIAVPITGAGNKEEILCSSWKLAIAVISDQAEYDAFVKETIAKAKKEQHLTEGQVAEAKKKGISIESVNQMNAGATLTFKNDHSLRACSFDPIHGQSNCAAGTWLLNGDKLTQTCQGTSTTSVIVSLSKSQLGLKNYGLTFTYIRSN